MEDFIELGIEGVDKVVDKHFHKLPDSALQSKTYHPRNIKKHMRRHSKDSPSPSRSSSPSPPRRRATEPDPNLAYQDPYYENPGGYINMQDNEIPRNHAASPIYSHEPPHQRQQYMPAYAPPPYAGGPFPPPPPQAPPGGFQHPYDQERDKEFYKDHHYYVPPTPGWDEGRRNENRYDSDDESGYHSDTRSRKSRKSRPGNRRRSSSYHGSRAGGDLALAKRGKGRDDSGGLRDNVKDKAHRYGVKDEIKDVFTTSRNGLAGAAVGAVVGGWAAQKAQVAQTGKDCKGKSNMALTLFGAAVGGLLADAIVHKVEVSREDSKKEEENWDEGRDRSTSPVPRRRPRERSDSFDSRSPSPRPRRSKGSRSKGRSRRGSYSDDSR